MFIFLFLKKEIAGMSVHPVSKDNDIMGATLQYEML